MCLSDEVTLREVSSPTPGFVQLLTALVHAHKVIFLRLSNTVTFIHTCICWITPEYSCRVAHYMVHYRYYPWQITPCAVLWGIPSGRIYSCVLLSCSRTLFHLMAVLRCLDVLLDIVMRFLIQGAEDLSTRSAVCMLWNKLPTGTEV